MKSIDSKKIITIIITNGRWPELRECLESLFISVESSVDLWNVEVYVGLNGVSAPDWLKSQRVQLYELQQHLPPPEARNVLLTRIRGEDVLFLDDDVVVPKDFLKDLRGRIDENPDVAVFGGPNLTHPKASLFEKCAGRALASKFGTAGVSRRYSAKTDETITHSELPFTLCNLCVRAGTSLPFKKGIGVGEETELLQRLLRNHKALFSSRLFVWHHRRKTALSFLQQMFKYGRGRGVTLKEASRPRRLQFFFLLVAYFAIATLVMLWPVAMGTALFVFYFLASVGIILREQWPWPAFFLFPLSFVLIHVFYPLGVMRGLARV